jgi:hypothetical protein
MHTLPNLPDTAAREVYASLHKFLPPPSPDTAETRAARDDEAMEAVAALHPTDAVDARFAADIVILEATGRDGLLLANDHHADIATVIRCRAQAASSFRQMRTLLREYRSIQAERDKALDAMHPAAMGRAGYWFRDVSVPAPAPVPEPAAAPAPDTPAAQADGPGNGRAFEDLTEAEQYALIYPDRAALIRAGGGLPARVTFGPPEPELVEELVNGTSPILRALDRPALAVAAE